MKELVGYVEGQGSVKRVKFLEDRDSAERALKFPFLPLPWEFGYAG